MRILTVVPALQIEFVEETLECLSHQTRIPDICYFLDESVNGDYRAKVESCIHNYPEIQKNIKFIVESGKTKTREIVKNALIKLHLQQDDLIHILSDTDVIYPYFYEYHEALHQAGDFPLTLCQQWIIDKNNRVINGQSLPSELKSSTDRFLSLDLGYILATVASKNNNWLGGFSNIVWRSSSLNFLNTPGLGGVYCAIISELTTVLSAIANKPCGYINIPLGGARVSGGGDFLGRYQTLPKSEMLGLTSIIIGAWNAGCIENDRFIDYIKLNLTNLKKLYADDEQLIRFVDFISSKIQKNDFINDYNSMYLQLLNDWGIDLSSQVFTEFHNEKKSPQISKKVVIDIPLNTITAFNIRNNHKGLTEEWLNYRLNLFFDTTLRCILRQTDKDFYCVIHYMKESESIVRKFVSKQPALPDNIIFSCDGDAFIENVAKQCVLLYKLRLDSDNIIHPSFVENLKKINYKTNLQCIIGRKGYIYESSTGRLALWDHDSSAFNTYVFPTEKYNKDSCLPSWEPEYHMSAVKLEHEFLFANSMEGRSYVIMAHGGNLQNEFDELIALEHWCPGMVEDESLKHSILKEFCIVS